MGPHKIREMMKNERELAKRRFRRQKNKNCLAIPGIHECIIVLDHLKPTYNIGKIFRSADAFGARESILETNLPFKSAFIFGHKEFGISFEPDLFPAIRRLTIPQSGKSQSLNVSVAASILLYEYTRQHRKIDKKSQGS